MRFRIGHVFELPQGYGAGNGCTQLLCFSFCTEHTFFPGRVDDIRSQRAHERLFFHGEFCRYYKDDPVSPVQCGKSDSETGVACGAFHNGSARLQQAFLFRILDHGPADPVLYTAARIIQLQLCKQIDAFRQIQVGKLYDRRISDEILG